MRRATTCSPASSRLIVGCSGGGDSVALVDVLARLAPQAGLTLAVAHLHHGWRGAEATNIATSRGAGATPRPALLGAAASI